MSPKTEEHKTEERRENKATAPFDKARALLLAVGLKEFNCGTYARRWLPPTDGKPVLASRNPATERVIAKVFLASEAEYDKAVLKANETFPVWGALPFSKRAEIIREICESLRRYKTLIGKMVSIEVGKIQSEGEGEVQEVIDHAERMVGLARDLGGPVGRSERKEHFAFEEWSPMGSVGIITAFNFPVAVWGWNAITAAICGNTTVWKPSLGTPLTAIAVQKVLNSVMQRHGFDGVFNLVIGSDEAVGERMTADTRLPLLSFTGSCEVGKRVAAIVGKRLGRYILELGGNNAVVVMDDADTDLALRAVTFASIGTAGQRCTTSRRLLLQRKIASAFTEKLIHAYQNVVIGDPLEPETLVGPLANAEAIVKMKNALIRAKKEGGTLLHGGMRIPRLGHFVEPAIVAARHDMPIVKEETFAPILYVMVFDTLDEAIKMNNDVPQGLSSAIFTKDMKNAFKFITENDCGIVNVNAGTSGAEIGLAFGGNKETGGGREAGSDSWKNYMIRKSCTINWSDELPLAQGIKFFKD